MSKRSLTLKLSILENQIIETLLEGHKEWRPDLGYPESHSDMQGAVRKLLRMFDVKHRPIPFNLEYEGEKNMTDQTAKCAGCANIAAPRSDFCSPECAQKHYAALSDLITGKTVADLQDALRKSEAELAALSPPPSQEVEEVAARLEARQLGEDIGNELISDNLRDACELVSKLYLDAATLLRTLSTALQKAEAKLDAILAPQAASVSVQKWISVDEAPKKAGHYLCKLPHQMMVCWYGDVCGRAHRSGWSWNYESVTHWMPLPAAKESP